MRWTPMSDGTMRCHNCGADHIDWRKDGEYVVNSYHHSGVVIRWRCGKCGAITEGEKP